jgi:hypothetical protein
MSEGATGVALLVIIATVSATVWHAKQAHHLRASCWSAIQAGLTWSAFVLLFQGSKDPFGAVGTVFAIFWSFVIAYLVGLVFRWHRSAGQA